MFLNILVATDGSGPSRRALEQAIDIARAVNSKLTLMTVAPPLSHYVTLAGVSGETMRAELDRWAADVLTQAIAAVPDDVVAHRVQRSGHASLEILAEVECGGCDLLVLEARGVNLARVPPRAGREYRRLRLLHGRERVSVPLLRALLHRACEPPRLARRLYHPTRPALG
jgi:nucleotide-binding universal stress UspA family protein